MNVTMALQLDEDKLTLVADALAKADELVTLVIKGDGRATRFALDLARVLSDIKRKNVLPR